MGIGQRPLGEGDDEEHRRLAEEMYARWLAGEAKSQLELAYWNDGTSHGKRFTAYVRRWLGVETERRSEQTERIVVSKDYSGSMAFPQPMPVISLRSSDS